ncbi:hypothetical protein [Pelagibacterium luteolum]|uniref:Uncharacterized protein n=1 Tax=Pelagibacterium luteolum TaxID=440168 RepID=A0A1G7TW45_9HYPH|nr:hypothetical protein [Pelagibacterium luteolum]SDG39567.1 hypothetical protein SAMN04487974_102386 [Pelagibacterium luteolum]
MGIGTLVTILVAVLIGLGLKTIVKDWRKKFAEDDAHAEQRRKAFLERNKAEVKSGGVVNLERGDDGVYRPKD